MSKSGGRLAKNISIEDFKKKLEKLCKENPDWISKWELGAFNALDSSQITKDLSKVTFNNENWAFTNKNCSVDCSLGFHSIDGLSFLLGSAGGDWERGVVFCLYVDNKDKIRGYVPEDGNTYDKRYKCAYGSQCEYTDMLPEDEDKTDDELEELFSFDNAPKADQTKLVADICNRIKLA